MRIANVAGRAKLLVDDRLVDINEVSGGQFSADPMQLIPALDELARRKSDWPLGTGVPMAGARLGPPVPRPSKILAAAGNYREHIAEDGGARVVDEGEPNLFARLPSALAGPFDAIEIPPGRVHVDWEAELVVVIGSRAKRISENEAWSHVAGVMCGQDISDRDEQRRGSQQFTMAKSFDTYAPVGPFLVTVDELDDRDDIRLECFLNGEQVQSGSTRELIFSIPTLISWASKIATLEPGDLFFTGTPAGVGAFRDPPRWLRPGDELRTNIVGVGEIESRVTSG